MLATYTGNTEAFAFLLGRGADVNSVDFAGNSILMGAAFKGHGAMVDALVATRAYEANIGAMELSKNMAQQSLRILG